MILKNYLDPDLVLEALSFWNTRLDALTEDLRRARTVILAQRSELKIRRAEANAVAEIVGYEEPTSTDEVIAKVGGLKNKHDNAVADLERLTKAAWRIRETFSFYDPVGKFVVPEIRMGDLGMDAASALAALWLLLDELDKPRYPAVEPVAQATAAEATAAVEQGSNATTSGQAPEGGDLG
jgi:hypothetical protein